MKSGFQQVTFHSLVGQWWRITAPETKDSTTLDAWTPAACRHSTASSQSSRVLQDAQKRGRTSVKPNVSDDMLRGNRREVKWGVGWSRCWKRWVCVCVRESAGEDGQKDGEEGGCGRDKKEESSGDVIIFLSLFCWWTMSKLQGNGQTKPREREREF